MTDPPTIEQPAAKPQPAAEGGLPRLADGVELIGEFADSGFKTPPFIARRSDGQVVQMPERLFRLAEAIDGQSAEPEIATRFSHAIERQVSAEDVNLLIDQQLRPLGIVAPESGDGPAELTKVDPLLALKFRAAIVPARVVDAITGVFRPLFLPAVMVCVLLAFIGLDSWLFFVHGIDQGLRHVLNDPVLMLLLIAGVILATAFHETGHATACRYGGAKPGVMGVGIYLVWPAFYTDITDAYRLGKWGRLRADIGGIYFNAIFALVIGALYFATGFQPLLLLVALQTFEMVQQALPFLRLDGYYILSDLTGVPDIYLRIRPVLASFIPGRAVDTRVAELKHRVRVAVSVYVVLISLALTVMALALVINLPRILSTGYVSAAHHWSRVGPAFSHGKVATGVLDLVQTLFLLLPSLGLAYTALRFGRRGVTSARRWSAGHPARQTVLAAVGAVAIVVAALSWWPNGDYKPIFRHERGTLPGLLREITALPTGRPSLPAQSTAAPSHAGSGSAQSGRSQGKHRHTKSRPTHGGPNEIDTISTPGGATGSPTSTGPTSAGFAPGSASSPGSTTSATTPSTATTTPAATTTTPATTTTTPGVSTTPSTVPGGASSPPATSTTSGSASATSTGP